MTNIIDTLTSKEKKCLREVSLAKDDVLFHENDACTSIGILAEGKLKIVTYLDDGREVIYNIVNVEDIFGNNLIFSSSPFYKGDVVALEDSTVYLLDRDSLIKILKKNESFMIGYLERQSDFSKKLNNTIKLLSIQSAEDRLLYYFHLYGNKISFTSITELANELYLTRESLSRLLSKMEKEDRIARKGHTIVLNNAL